MSLFNNHVSTSRISLKSGSAIPRSNILGATGLPRTVLAAMFRRDGLFGRDSSLTPAEQAMLQSRLPSIRGLAARPIASVPSPRLSAIAGFADALIAGEEHTETQRLRLVREGLSGAAISEIEIVIENISVVFGDEDLSIEVIRPATAAAYPKAA